MSVHTITGMIQTVSSKNAADDHAGTTTRILIDKEHPLSHDNDAAADVPPTSTVPKSPTVGALASAVAKAFPIYSRKSKKIHDIDTYTGGSDSDSNRDCDSDSDSNSNNSDSTANNGSDRIHVSFLQNSPSSSSPDNNHPSPEIISDIRSLTAAQHLTDGVIVMIFFCLFAVVGVVLLLIILLC